MADFNNSGFTYLDMSGNIVSQQPNFGATPGPSTLPSPQYPSMDTSMPTAIPSSVPSQPYQQQAPTTDIASSADWMGSINQYLGEGAATAEPAEKSFMDTYLPSLTPDTQKPTSDVMAFFRGVKDTILSVPEEVGKVGKALGIPGGAELETWGKTIVPEKPYDAGFAEKVGGATGWIVPIKALDIAGDAMFKYLPGYGKLVGMGLKGVSKIVPLLFGVAKYQSIKEEAEKAGVDPGALPWIDAGLEVAMMSVIPLATRGFLTGSVNKALPLAEITKKTVGEMIRPTAGQILTGAMIDTLSTAASFGGVGALQKVLESKYGLNRPDIGKASLESAEVMGATALLSLVPGHAFRRMVQSKAIDSLEKVPDPSDQKAIDQRLINAEVVAKALELNPKNQELADEWRAYSLKQINDGQRIEVNKPIVDAMRPPVVPPPVLPEEEYKEEPVPAAYVAGAIPEPGPTLAERNVKNKGVVVGKKLASGSRGIAGEVGIPEELEEGGDAYERAQAEALNEPGVDNAVLPYRQGAQGEQPASRMASTRVGAGIENVAPEGIPTKEAAPLDLKAKVEDLATRLSGGLKIEDMSQEDADLMRSNAVDIQKRFAQLEEGKRTEGAGKSVDEHAKMIARNMILEARGEKTDELYAKPTPAFLAGLRATLKAAGTKASAGAKAIIGKYLVSNGVKAAELEYRNTLAKEIGKAKKGGKTKPVEDTEAAIATEGGAVKLKEGEQTPLEREWVDLTIKATKGEREKEAERQARVAEIERLDKLYKDEEAEAQAPYPKAESVREKLKPAKPTEKELMAWEDVFKGFSAKGMKGIGALYQQYMYGKKAGEPGWKTRGRELLVKLATYAKNLHTFSPKMDETTQRKLVINDFKKKHGVDISDTDAKAILDIASGYNLKESTSTSKIQEAYGVVPENVLSKAKLERWVQDNKVSDVDAIHRYILDMDKKGMDVTDVVNLANRELINIAEKGVPVAGASPAKIAKAKGDVEGITKKLNEALAKQKDLKTNIEDRIKKRIALNKAEYAKNKKPFTKAQEKRIRDWWTNEIPKRVKAVAKEIKLLRGQLADAKIQFQEKPAEATPVVEPKKVSKYLYNIAYREKEPFKLEVKEKGTKNKPAIETLPLKPGETKKIYQTEWVVKRTKEGMKSSTFANDLITKATRIVRGIAEHTYVPVQLWEWQSTRNDAMQGIADHASLLRTAADGAKNSREREVFNGMADKLDHELDLLRSKSLLTTVIAHTPASVISRVTKQNELYNIQGSEAKEKFLTDYKKEILRRYEQARLLKDTGIKKAESEYHQFYADNTDPAERKKKDKEYVKDKDRIKELFSDAVDNLSKELSIFKMGLTKPTLFEEKLATAKKSNLAEYNSMLESLGLSKEEMAKQMKDAEEAEAKKILIQKQFRNEFAIDPFDRSEYYKVRPTGNSAAIKKGELKVSSKDKDSIGKLKKAAKGEEVVEDKADEIIRQLSEAGKKVPNDSEFTPGNEWELLKRTTEIQEKPLQEGWMTEKKKKEEEDLLKYAEKGGAPVKSQKQSAASKWARSVYDYLKDKEANDPNWLNIQNAYIKILVSYLDQYGGSERASRKIVATQTAENIRKLDAAYKAGKIAFNFIAQLQREGASSKEQDAMSIKLLKELGELGDKYNESNKVMATLKEIYSRQGIATRTKTEKGGVEVTTVHGGKEHFEFLNDLIRNNEWRKFVEPGEKIRVSKPVSKAVLEQRKKALKEREDVVNVARETQKKIFGELNDKNIADNIDKILQKHIDELNAPLLEMQRNDPGLKYQEELAVSLKDIPTRNYAEYISKLFDSTIEDSKKLEAITALPDTKEKAVLLIVKKLKDYLTFVHEDKIRGEITESRGGRTKTEAELWRKSNEEGDSADNINALNTQSEAFIKSKEYLSLEKKDQIVFKNAQNTLNSLLIKMGKKGYKENPKDEIDVLTLNQIMERLRDKAHEFVPTEKGLETADDFQATIAHAELIGGIIRRQKRISTFSEWKAAMKENLIHTWNRIKQYAKDMWNRIIGREKYEKSEPLNDEEWAAFRAKDGIDFKMPWAPELTKSELATGESLFNALLVRTRALRKKIAADGIYVEPWLADSLRRWTIEKEYNRKWYPDVFATDPRAERRLWTDMERFLHVAFRGITPERYKELIKHMQEMSAERRGSKGAIQMRNTDLQPYNLEDKELRREVKMFNNRTEARPTIVFGNSGWTLERTRQWQGRKGEPFFRRSEADDAYLGALGDSLKVNLLERLSNPEKFSDTRTRKLNDEAGRTMYTISLPDKMSISIRYDKENPKNSDVIVSPKNIKLMEEAFAKVDSTNFHSEQLAKMNRDFMGSQKNVEFTKRYLQSRLPNTEITDHGEGRFTIKAGDFTFTLEGREVSYDSKDGTQIGGWTLPETGVGLAWVAKLGPEIHADRTLFHEMFHMAADVYMTKGEQDFLLNRYRREGEDINKVEIDPKTGVQTMPDRKAVWERVSRAYGAWAAADPVVPQRDMFMKIMDGAKELLSTIKGLVFSVSPEIKQEKLFNLIQSGEIYNRQKLMNYAVGKKAPEFRSIRNIEDTFKSTVEDLKGTQEGLQSIINSKVAKSMPAVRSVWEKTWEKMKELHRWFMSSNPPSDVKRILYRYIGEMQLLNKELTDYGEDMKARFTPDRQEAMTRYANAYDAEKGVDMELLNKWARESSPEYRERLSEDPDLTADEREATRDAFKNSHQHYLNALTLSAEEKEAVHVFRQRMDNLFQAAYEMGVIKQWINHYVTAEWGPSNRIADKLTRMADAGQFEGLNFRANPSEAKRKLFRTIFQGEMLGRELKNGQLGYLAVKAERSVRQAIETRRALKQLMNTRMSDGRYAVVVGGEHELVENPDGNEPTGFLIKPNSAEHETSDYPSYNRPQMRNWRWEEIDPETNKSVIKQGQMKIHPDAMRHINAVWGTSALRNYTIPKGVPVIGGFQPGKFLLNVSSTAKSTMLVGPFHLMHTSEHGVFHKVDLFEMMKDTSIDLNKDPIVKEGIMLGLHLYDHDARAIWQEGVAAGGLWKYIPGKVFGGKTIGERLDQFTAFTFQRWIPKLKAEMFKNALTRALGDKYDGLKGYEAKNIASGKITREQVIEREAQHANDAFGGQNWKAMGVNPTLLDTMRLLMLAPDFLIARLKFGYQAGKYVATLGKSGGREQAYALVRGAVMMSAIAQITSLIIGDEHKFHWDKPFSVIVGKKEYQPRSVIADINHMYTDFRNFSYNRMNPLLMRPPIEFMTGRDKFGRHVDTIQFLKDTVQSLLPIPAQGLIRQRPEDKLLRSIFDTMVMQASGVTNYPYRTAFDRAVAERFHERFIISSPPVQRKRTLLARNYALQIQAANDRKEPTGEIMKEISDDIRKGKLDAVDIKSILDKSRESQTEVNLKSLSVEDIKEIWDKALPEERKKYEKYKLKKWAMEQGKHPGRWAEMMH